MFCEQVRSIFRQTCSDKCLAKLVRMSVWQTCSLMCLSNMVKCTLNKFGRRPLHMIGRTFAESEYIRSYFRRIRTCWVNRSVNIFGESKHVRSNFRLVRKCSVKHSVNPNMFGQTFGESKHVRLNSRRIRTFSVNRSANIFGQCRTCSFVKLSSQGQIAQP